MAAAQFFFFIIAVGLRSTANADLCIWSRGGGLLCLLCSGTRSGGHRHSPQALPEDRTGMPQPPGDTLTRG